MSEHVFIVQHSYQLDDREETKFIGVYSSQEAAELAVARLSLQRGFRDHPNDFHVDRYTLDEDHWTDGLRTKAL